MLPTSIGIIQSGGGISIPLAPSTCTASKNGIDRANCSWASSTGATSYTLEQSFNSGGSWSVISTSAVSPYTTGPMFAGTLVTFRVKACNSAGCSGYTVSNEVEIG